MLKSFSGLVGALVVVAMGRAIGAPAVPPPRVEPDPAVQQAALAPTPAPAMPEGPKGPDAPGGQAPQGG